MKTMPTNIIWTYRCKRKKMPIQGQGLREAVYKEVIYDFKSVTFALECIMLWPS